MKKSVCALVVVGAIVMFGTQALCDKQVGPRGNDSRMTLRRNTQGLFYAEDTLLHNSPKFGVQAYLDQYDTLRTYYQWLLPTSLIPDGSIVDSVRLQVLCSTPSPGSSFWISRIDSNASPSTLRLDQLYFLVRWARGFEQFFQTSGTTRYSNSAIRW